MKFSLSLGATLVVALLLAAPRAAQAQTEPASNNVVPVGPGSIPPPASPTSREPRTSEEKMQQRAARRDNAVTNDRAVDRKRAKAMPADRKARKADRKAGKATDDKI